MKQFLAIFSLSLLFLNSSAQILELNQKHIEVTLRSIGHQILLNSGDSSSRVLPVVSKGNNYIISFENEVALQPEITTLTIDSALQTTNFCAGFIAEIKNCNDSLVVHSYAQYNLAKLNEPSCLGRDLPKGCYFIEITLLNESEVSSFVDVPNKQKEEESEPKKQLPSFGWMAIPFLLFLGFLYFRKQGKPQPKILHAKPLGKYEFDEISMKLKWNDEIIELSGKESELLSLLVNHINQTVKKEEILNKVWGNEDTYIGRTLDVTISKLRKKLQNDPEISIENIRGVGYKLICN